MMMAAIPRKRSRAVLACIESTMPLTKNRVSPSPAKPKNRTAKTRAVFLLATFLSTMDSTIRLNSPMGRSPVRLTAGIDDAAYIYDPVNLVASVKDHHNRTTTFSYNDMDLRTKTVYPNGVTMEAKWDKSRRLEWIASFPATNRAGCIDTSGNPKTGTGCHTMFKYNYTNPANGLDTMTRSSVTDRNNRKTDYRYDPIDRLTSATTLDAARTTTLAKYEYLFDGNPGKRGNITKKLVTGTTVPNETVTYSHNDANELVSDSTGTYAHDLTGNMTRNARGLAFAYNLKNQTESVTRGCPVRRRTS